MEHMLKLGCYLISFLSICFLGSVFLIKNGDCPECLKNNKATHISLIIMIIIITYFNVYAFAVSVFFGLISYLISYKIIWRKK